MRAFQSYSGLRDSLFTDMHNIWMKNYLGTILNTGIAGSPHFLKVGIYAILGLFLEGGLT
jgi:hypothetical protein